jgi:hypothetical protein
VEVLTAAEGWRSVRLDTGSKRISDALNEPDRATLAAGLEIDDVCLVVPPPQPSGDPARRLHRPAHQLWVRMGESSVVGSLHLPPGTVGSAYLMRRNHRFFVLTDATVTWPLDDGREERRVPVLLVNLQRVSSLRDTPEPDRDPTLAAPPV